MPKYNYPYKGDSFVVDTDRIKKYWPDGGISTEITGTFVDRNGRYNVVPTQIDGIVVPGEVAWSMAQKGQNPIYFTSKDLGKAEAFAQKRSNALGEFYKTGGKGATPFVDASEYSPKLKRDPKMASIAEAMNLKVGKDGIR